MIKSGIMRKKDKAMINAKTESEFCSNISTIVFDFLYTLKKISEFENVVKVALSDQHRDIFIVLEQDNEDLSEEIMQTFAKWECDYKSFPELHIINKDETFYIPSGALYI